MPRAQDKPGLFTGPNPRLWTVPHGAPFLDTLARALIAASPEADPFALSDALILTPTRKAAHTLADALRRASGRPALLVPAIRPLGEIDEDSDDLGPEALFLDAAPAIAPLKRLFELAGLVRARFRAEGRPDDARLALSLAHALARLIDQAAGFAEVDWSRLDTLVEEADLAAHWRENARFLKIVAELWPARLAEEGLMDPAARTDRILRALADRWRTAPPDRMVVIAGSTGAAPAVRELIAACAHLPKGAVVFSGLDLELDEAAWAQVDAQHPQSALKATLHKMGAARDQVRILGEDPRPNRRRLFNEAMRPAAATADWLDRLLDLGQTALRDGARGVAILEAATENEEALAIALSLRGAMEIEGARAALITPKADLAERVAAKLRRWGLAVAPNGGRRLSQSVVGELLLTLCDASETGGDSVSLAMLVASPALEIDAAARAAFERAFLRGPKLFTDLEDLRARAGKTLAPEQARALDPLLAALTEGLAPLLQDDEHGAASDHLSALARLAEALCESQGRGRGKALWAQDGGEECAQILREAIEASEHFLSCRPQIALDALRALIEAGRTRPNDTQREPIAILRPLDARLVDCDLLVLGGLNEGEWPQTIETDPFLSLGLKRKLGLPPPEERQGLAAYDFVGFGCAPRVILTRSVRAGNAPTIASRWLWRLQTLTRGDASGESLFEPAEGENPLHWARALDAPRRRSPPAQAPRPKPPAESRPRALSFTDIGKLVRDPYEIYARRILRLKPIDPIGAGPDQRQRGTAIHAAIEAFSVSDLTSLDDFARMFDQALAEHGFDAGARRHLAARLKPAMAQFVRWRAEQAASGSTSLIEVSARMRFELPSGPADIYGRADRIDLSSDGLAMILDFKTGGPPSGPQVRSGLEPQLPLEAALFAKGAFGAHPKAKPAGLAYWAFTANDFGVKPVATGVEDTAALAELALARALSLIETYSKPNQAFLSKPRVQFAKPYGDYDLLARRAEWTTQGGAE